jgi:hypothetical protein
MCYNTQFKNSSTSAFQNWAKNIAAKNIAVNLLWPKGETSQKEHSARKSSNAQPEPVLAKTLQLRTLT